MENKYFKDMDYKEISRKLVYSGKKVKVEELEYLNGDKLVYREHVDVGNASVILPITENNEIIMVQETRTPIGRLVISLPVRNDRRRRRGRKSSYTRIRRGNWVFGRKYRILKRILF